MGRHVEVEPNELPNIAMKDNDFNSRRRRIFLGNLNRAALLEQLEMDVKFLESHYICDYSFLVGYHFMDEKESEEFGLRGEDSVVDRRRYSRV